MSQKYYAGEWHHPFGPGEKPTQCRIVIELSEPKIVAAQEWTENGYVNMRKDRLADLENSVFAVNEAHLSPPETYDLKAFDEFPQWEQLYAPGKDPIAGMSGSIRIETARLLDMALDWAVSDCERLHLVNK